MLSNSALYEHIFLENIKNLYKSAGKCADRKNYKAILEEYLLSTPEEIMENSPMSLNPSVSVKNPSAIKLLRQFYELLDVKQKTDILRLGAAKSEPKAFKTGNIWGSSIPKRQRHTKINTHVKTAIFHCILQDPQVIQSPITND